MTLNELMKELGNVYWRLEEIIKKSEFELYDDLSALEIDWNDPEELFLVDELRAILKKINDVNKTVQYLNAQIKVSGRLHRNSYGRFEVNGYEFHCGDGIEALMVDPYDGESRWVASRIEHDMNDFYIVGYKDVKLEDLYVRVRN